MEIELLTPVISAISALLGVALNAAMNLKSQAKIQSFQLDAEAAKHNRDRAERAENSAIERAHEAHMKLSWLAREFSLTNIDILRTQGVQVAEYNARYLRCCEVVDELRAFAGVWAPELSDEMDALGTEMSMFWGHFKISLVRTSEGKSFEEMKEVLLKAHEAGTAVGVAARVAKRKLETIAAALSFRRAASN